jgi:hypothetical protein
LTKYANPFLLSVAATQTANAATYVLDGNELIGATVVNVNGTFNDVTFIGGGCSTLAQFDDCDEPADLTFWQGIDSANDASQALLTQLFEKMIFGIMTQRQREVVLRRIFATY